MGKQLSSEWIDANIGKMINNADLSVMESGLFLDVNRSMIRTKANVLYPQGINSWNVFNLAK